MLRPLPIALVALALVVSACGDDDEPADAPTTTAATTTPAPTTAAPTTAAPTEPPVTEPPLTDEYLAFRESPTACGAERPDPVEPMAFDAAEDQGLASDTLVRVVLQTSCGDIQIDLDPGLSPVAVNSFVFLARQGYFDGSVSHRVMADFMFQAGDQTARGNGRPGYLLPVDEFPEPGFRYERGVVAMANAGAETTGSQFFVMLGFSGLPPNYTPIGNVVGGFETLDAIAAIPVGPNARGEVSFPLETLYIEKVTVAG